jgi:hypothetical protein
MGAVAVDERVKIFSRPRATCHSDFHIGGVSVGISGNNSKDVALPPLLQSFRAKPGAINISLRVEWAKNLVSSNKQSLFDSGCTWHLYQCDGGLEFDFIAPFFGAQPYRRLFVDDQLSTATLQMNESCGVYSSWAGFALSYPLDELLIMHRLTQERATELHGTGIVRANGVANLFVGHSGAGKSTTTRFWTSLEEVEVLSDDRIIVRLDDGRDGPAGPTGMRMYGTPWHGEAMFASPNSAPLSRIFVLEHGHGNVITRLSRSEAVGELFARAFVPFHRHEYLENALSFLEQLASSVPCYRYSFEPDERAVEKIQKFND